MGLERPQKKPAALVELRAKGLPNCQQTSLKLPVSCCTTLSKTRKELASPGCFQVRHRPDPASFRHLRRELHRTNVDSCCCRAGLVSDWPSVQLWRGVAGLQYLQELAGASQVQAMISTDKEPLFFGDMRQSMPQGCSFSDFLSTADGLHSLSASQGPAQTSHSLVQAYLAQASLDPGHPLQALRRDFEVPDVISHADVTRTNLWMSIRYSISVAQTRARLVYMS